MSAKRIRMVDAGRPRRRVWWIAIAGACVVALVWWLRSTDLGVDRQRNDAVIRVLQYDRQLDEAKKQTRAVKKAIAYLRADWALLHASQGNRARMAFALKAMSDGSDAFRNATRRLLEAYAAMGLYQGDIRGARQVASNTVATVQDAIFSYGEAYRRGGSLDDGDRAWVRARLGFDNFNDASADLWHSALNRRNQPLEEARRTNKPFPFSLFDRPQLPPNRTESPDG